MRVPARQYRYPDLRSEYEKAQDRMEQVEVPQNRKRRANLRGLYR